MRDAMLRSGFPILVGLLAGTACSSKTGPDDTCQPPSNPGCVAVLENTQPASGGTIGVTGTLIIDFDRPRATNVTAGPSGGQATAAVPVTPDPQTGEAAQWTWTASFNQGDIGQQRQVLIYWDNPNGTSGSDSVTLTVQ